MDRPITRQDTIALQLVQWLLDQLHSDEELDTVTRQLEALVSPLQGQSRTDLYSHISRLIFQRYSINPDERSAKLYVQLCHSLFLNSMKYAHGPSTSSQVMAVHDHLLHLCVTSLPPGYDVENKGPRESTSPWDSDDSGINLPGNSKTIPSVEGVTLLVSSLYESGLISVAQVYHYISQLTKPSSAFASGSGLPSVCTLLETHGHDLNIVPWKNEMERLLEWAETVMLGRTTDEYTQRRMKAIMFYLNESLDQELFEEADHESSPTPPHPSSVEEGPSPATVPFIILSRFILSPSVRCQGWRYRSARC